MRRAIIALGFVLQGLGACATPQPATQSKVSIEPEPELPGWMRMATPEDQMRIAALHRSLAAAVNGRRSFRDCGRLKFPSLAAGLISVISRFGDRHVLSSAGVRVASARPEGW